MKNKHYNNNDDFDFYNEDKLKNKYRNFESDEKNPYKPKKQDEEEFEDDDKKKLKEILAKKTNDERLTTNPFHEKNWQNKNTKSFNNSNNFKLLNKLNKQKAVLKTKYNIQYDYSQLVNEIREKDAKVSGNRYKYYKFRNKDGTIVYFPEYNVNILHHPSINKVIYNVSLYEFSNKSSYVMVYRFDKKGNLLKKEKYSVADFYARYKNYILFDK